MDDSTVYGLDCMVHVRYTYDLVNDFCNVGHFIGSHPRNDRDLGLKGIAGREEQFEKRGLTLRPCCAALTLRRQSFRKAGRNRGQSCHRIGPEEKGRMEGQGAKSTLGHQKVRQARG